MVSQGLGGNCPAGPPGLLYCHFFAPAPPRPLLTPEEFEKAIDDVSLNLPELLNESEGSLLTRCVFAFKESRIPVPYHRRKRFLVLTPMEEAILGQENVRQLKEKEVFYEDEADALAILFMKKAGLSPRYAIAALEKLTLEEGEDALWAAWRWPRPARQWRKTGRRSRRSS